MKNVCQKMSYAFMLFHSFDTFLFELTLLGVLFWLLVLVKGTTMQINHFF